MSSDTLRRLRGATLGRGTGRVVAVKGLSVTGTFPGVRLGQVLAVGDTRLEVAAFEDDRFVAMPLGPLGALGPDDEVTLVSQSLRVRAGDALLGRTLDALGHSVDDGPPLDHLAMRPLHAPAPPPLQRRPVVRPFVTGVRVIDALLTLGEGQRVGLFSASGVGKSTLLARLAAHAVADVVVVALVGERGREARDFVLRDLAEARARTVVVLSTADDPPALRLAAAHAATSIAEHFRDEGRRVLLLVDSLTRVARAQRDVGLASGETPARRGFPPSLSVVVPRLVERAGQGERGVITAIYTVLVEGDDLDEPVSDEARGALDGHIVLSRRLAERGLFPAVDLLASVSRVQRDVVPPEQVRAAAKVRAAVAAYEAKRELIELGAHQPGKDPRTDDAVRFAPRYEALVAQGAAPVPFDESARAILAASDALQRF